MTTDQIKHLEFIQGAITRMNANSFQLKEWAIAIVSALLALYANSSNVCYIFVAVIPTLLFWGLDAYYLQQERKFRGVYDNVAGLKDNTKDYIKVNLFEMPIDKFKGWKYSLWRSFFWGTIPLFYFGIIILLVLILIFKDCITKL